VDRIFVLGREGENMEGNLDRRVRRLERELRVWRFSAFALALVFLSGAAVEDRAKPKEIRLVSEDSNYAAVLRPDGLRLFAGDKLVGSITSRDEGEFGVTAEVELTDPRASVAKLATYGLTLGTGSDRTTVTSSGLRVLSSGAERTELAASRLELFNGTHGSKISLAVDDRGPAGVDILFGQHLIASIGSMRNFSTAESLDAGGLLLNKFGDKPSRLLMSAGPTTYEGSGSGRTGNLASPESVEKTR
jgi:hypothetical protein